VAGLTLLIQGAAYLNDERNLRFDALVAVTLAFVGGVSLLVGILTPITSLLVVLGTIGYAFSWLPAPSANLFDSKLAVIDVIAMATAIAFLGPGAYSLDARFFGRREIFIPPTQRLPKS
jgi:uncharacterized membrane protein YphA (DoxX/SURF4 family)